MIGLAPVALALAEDGGARRPLRRPRQPRPQVEPIQTGRNRNPGEREQRRGDVLELCRPRKAAPPRQAGRPQHQRHPHQLVVEVRAVLEQPVIPEPLAVVRGYDDGSLVEEVERAKPLQQATHLGVGVAHLTAVGADQSRQLPGVSDARGDALRIEGDGRVLRDAKSGGRGIRGVGVEEVDPDEEALAGVGGDPVHRRVHDPLASRPEAIPGASPPGVALRRCEGVDLEAPAEAEALVDDVARYEGGGRESGRAHPGGQAGQLGGYRNRVVEDAVAPGVEAGEERRVSRSGARRGRAGLEEQHATPGERVDRRSWDRSAIGTHVIGAQRVDGDEQDPADGCRGRRRSGQGERSHQRRRHQSAHGGSLSQAFSRIE